MSKVLLIESVDEDAAMMTTLFQEAGLDVVRAGDGREGVEMARSEQPDLIVLAVELPGLSGYMACKNIRRDSSLSSIPLIITSSTATDETFDQHRSLKTRADAYLHKPLNPETLMLSASEYVDIAPAPADNQGEPEDDGEMEDDLFLDPDDDVDEDDLLSDDLEIGELDDLEMDDVGDLLDFELTSQELDIDGLTDSVADVMGDLEVVDMDAEDASTAKPQRTSSGATPSVPGAALNLEFQEKENGAQDRNRVPTAPAPKPEKQKYDTAEATDGQFVQELLLQVEARDDRIETLENALEEAKKRATKSAEADSLQARVAELEAEVGQLKEEVGTLKDIEVTQQETIDRLQVEKDELSKKLEQASAEAGQADKAQEATRRADEAEAARAALETEMTELLGGIRELLDNKLSEMSNKE